MTVFQFTGSPLVNVCYKFDTYLATFAYCEFENKTGRVKGYSAPCLQSYANQSFFLFQQPMWMTVMCWCGAITVLSSCLILCCFARVSQKHGCMLLWICIQLILVDYEVCMVNG